MKPFVFLLSFLLSSALVVIGGKELEKMRDILVGDFLEACKTGDWVLYASTVSQINQTKEAQELREQGLRLANENGHWEIVGDLIDQEGLVLPSHLEGRYFEIHFVLPEDDSLESSFIEGPYDNILIPGQRPIILASSG